MQTTESFGSGSLRESQLIDESQATRIATKPESTTALALKMIDQPAQRDILFSATRTMVDLLTMHWTSKMLIQPSEAAKTPLTERTSIPSTIPRGRGGDIGGGIVVVVPADLLVGKDMIGIDFST